MVLKGFAAGRKVVDMQATLSRMRREKYGGLMPSADAFKAMFDWYGMRGEWMSCVAVLSCACRDLSRRRSYFQGIIARNAALQVAPAT